MNFKCWENLLMSSLVLCYHPISKNDPFDFYQQIEVWNVYWKHKSLSFGGRVCLLRSVLSSIPLFFMSFFKMPKSVFTMHEDPKVVLMGKW